ncbi:MAG: alpha/beta hydrolase [Bryobacteraceae bacterium]|nr:alpha/beta hydrolase [Bryobacteraceae bacterium]
MPRLPAHGIVVVNVSNPLPTLRGDADYLGQLVDRIPGRVVLVGHSYGDAVITNAATGRRNVKARVYVAAFVPDAGETAQALVGKSPGSTLGDALDQPVLLRDGGKDLYIQWARFRQQFAADAPKADAALIAATQRPIEKAALTQASGAPAGKDVPSWSIFGTTDKNIPPVAIPCGRTQGGEVKGRLASSWSPIPTRWLRSSSRPQGSRVSWESQRHSGRTLRWRHQ